DAISRYAEQVNREVEDIGARRLHTILETVLEEVSFGTHLGEVVIDEALVSEKLDGVVGDEDLSRYIL
ncbi:MAG TPA: HslU--HslV peptidase ATPase subunit, partial [Trueperaceae bacterium]|nr:HslU--HslV peptidase ATPase subunit [Trueperaceae bacterium]